MSLSEKTLTELHQMMSQNSDLLTQVQATDDATQAAALIAKAAAEHGISVSAAELADHFEQASAAAKDQALSDSQLEAVAGGWSKQESLIVVSFITFGIGCMVASIVQDAKGNRNNCKDSFTDKPNF